MECRVNHVRSNTDAQLSDNEHAEAITQQCQWNYCKTQYSSLPRRTGKQVPRHQARHKQHNTRTNPAALGRNVQYDAWQLKDHIFPKYRSASQLEEPECRWRRPPLEKGLYCLLHGEREGNHEQQKRKGERCPMKGSLVQKQRTNARHQKNEAECRNAH